MGNFIQLFEEFVLKAIVMTEDVIAAPIDEDRLESFTSNRERLLQIIESLSHQIDWTSIASDKRDDLNRQIEYIKKLDEKLLVKLQEKQIEVKKEIETTHRQGESIKGYNLNDVK